MIRKFRDTLALLIVALIIPTLWASQGLGILQLSGEVIGASIAGWTLILQFYFRKKPRAEETE